MPALERAVIDDLHTRLNEFLLKKGGYGTPQFLDAGGSAAVYKADLEGQPRAIKVFDPKFLNGPSGAAEKRRLDVQRRLMGHDCPYLVQMFDIAEAEGTAFTEMEFIPWPQLAKTLSLVPDDEVHLLISQLVSAVRFLESRDVVHRDIKPENIHVSPDFKQLKLLDLGVARAFEVADGEEATVTDTGQTRPFVATAQYSSPEYLFRLDAPTARLWKGLNFYQIGAVLHDLIMKRPLFEEEVEMNNRWLVARAVLSKIPSFVDGHSNRLSNLKAIAYRCLTKDLDTRLAIVDWNDFARDPLDDPMSRLKGRLLRSAPSATRLAKQSLETKKQWERDEFEKRFTESLRAEFLSVCEGKATIALRPPKPNTDSVYRFELAVSHKASILCFVCFDWQETHALQTAVVMYGAYLVESSIEGDADRAADCCACNVTISESETEALHVVMNKLAEAFLDGLDTLEVEGSDLSKLHGTDLVTKTA